MKEANPQTVRTLVQALASLVPDLLRLERDIKTANAQDVDAAYYGKRRPAWGPIEKRIVSLAGSADADPRTLLQLISALGTAVGIRINTTPLPPPRGYEVVSSGKFRSKPDRRRRELQEADS